MILEDKDPRLRVGLVYRNKASVEPDHSIDHGYSVLLLDGGRAPNAHFGSPAILSIIKTGMNGFLNQDQLFIGLPRPSPQAGREKYTFIWQHFPPQAEREEYTFIWQPFPPHAGGSRGGAIALIETSKEPLPGPPRTRGGRHTNILV